MNRSIITIITALALSSFIACATSHQRPIPVIPPSVAEVDIRYNQAAMARLPNEIKYLISESYKDVQAGLVDQGTKTSLQAIVDKFNNKSAGTGWRLRQISKEEYGWLPARCKCACYYLMLINESDATNRWQVTAPGGCGGLGFSPWRFKHENYTEITPINAFPPLKVDLSLTLEEMIADGQLDAIERPRYIKLTDIPFPVEKKLRKVIPRLVSFGHKISSFYAEKELELYGLRFASLAETLAFAAANRETYAKWKIVSLGWGYEEIWESENSKHANRFFLSLTLSEWRTFSFTEQEPSKWDENVYFLAIEKKEDKQ